MSKEGPDTMMDRFLPNLKGQQQQQPAMASVTRAFFEIVEFFSKNVEKIVEKGQNCAKK